MSWGVIDKSHWRSIVVELQHSRGDPPSFALEVLLRVGQAFANVGDQIFVFDAARHVHGPEWIHHAHRPSRLFRHAFLDVWSRWLENGSMEGDVLHCFEVSPQDGFDEGVPGVQRVVLSSDFLVFA